jgi:hypothetical protein
MNMFELFKVGAMALATPTMEYAAVHRDHGLSAADWDIVTSKEPWTPTQRRQARSIIAECVQISLTIAGLPAQSLPAQYVAAVITAIVAPVNLLVAASSAPESFDALGAANVETEFQVHPVKREQMQSLVLLYAGGFRSEPMAAQTGQTDLNEDKKGKQNA